MNDIVSYNHYRFVYMDFKRSYHHTDNTKGSPYHYLAYMQEGRCKIVSDRETVEIQTGDVFFIPDGLPYHSYWYGQPNIKFHSYGFKHFPEAASNHFRLQTVACPEQLRERIKNIPFSPRPDSHALGLFYSCLNDILPLLKTERSSHASKSIFPPTSIFRSIPSIPFPELPSFAVSANPPFIPRSKKPAAKPPMRFGRKFSVKRRWLY